MSLFLTALALVGLSNAPDEAAEPKIPMVISVVVVSYFPLDGEHIDRKVTGDVGEPYAVIKAKTERLTKELQAALEKGSTFRGYKNPQAKPSLTYKVIGNYEFLKPLPTCPLRPGESAPMTDYNAIMKEIDVVRWVEKRGAKQIWIWGYHGGKVGLWESNMASPYGDVSNSNRDPRDLPVCAKTYTVYHYNYQRGLGEAIEDHMHQLEALLNHVDGRDTARPEDWPKLLFWGKFVGSDATHKIATKPARCGWTHYAPNSERDYDWQNKRYVESDIEDWHPDKIGKTQLINSDRWNNDPIQWRIYWLQAIPGADNGLTHNGKRLRNWWTFVYNWDTAKRENRTLTHK